MYFYEPTRHDYKVKDEPNDKTNMTNERTRKSSEQTDGFQQRLYGKKNLNIRSVCEWTGKIYCVLFHVKR